jgi:uncharacterized protein (DUF1778 family)
MAPARKLKRDDRLDFRLTAEHKRLIEQAASVAGQPLTTFAVSRLIHAAEEVLARETERVLSDRDRIRFFEILDRERPNARLARAARRYRSRHGE